ncbi:LysM receptor kinase [Melia azedarach]|uniref:LysM receptor kinase n=1 Tax=Melia azedarach TaxID=155640 RepID=A0ACC1WVT2_MELAZ|nr:LysM receptor kinase [Melia azedarach]
MEMEKFFTVWSVLVLFQLVLIHGQQTYVNNKQLACYDHANDNFTRGFACNGVNSSCQSYLTFRSNPLYNSPVDLNYLLNSSTDLIASINNITTVTTVPTDDQVIIPVNCSCSGQYYQHTTTHKIENSLETYFSIANDTYQGLSTCQALMAQNNVGDKNLTVGLDVLVPLRCACPTAKQTASGFNYLLVYMVTWGDSISKIAELFNVDNIQSILDANQLSADDNIYPFTPILVPLKTPPTKIQRPATSPPPPPASPPQAQLTPTESNSSKKWVYIGVGIGAGLLLLVSVLAFLFCFYRRKSKKPTPVSSSGPKTLSDDYSMFPENSKSSLPISVSSQGIRDTVESLTVYKFQDLQIATGSFSEENRIKGSVYKGSFKGDDAAIKVMKGDVSSEINILKKINHSNIVRIFRYSYMEAASSDCLRHC